MKKIELDFYHQVNKEIAINNFCSTQKTSRDCFSQMHEGWLSKQIEEEYKEFIKLNNTKNMFYVARTPITLFALIVTFYTISFEVGFRGQMIIASLTICSLGISIFLLIVWSYLRYTGKCCGITSGIDRIVELIWNKVSCMYSIYIDCMACN